MTVAEEKLLNSLIHSVGLSNNLRDIEVRAIYESQFRFIYNTIRELNLRDIEPDEVNELKTNFILKHIGKLYTTPGQVRITNNRKNKKEEHGEQSRYSRQSERSN